MKKGKILLLIITILLSVSISKAQNKTIGIGRLQVSLNHDIPLYHVKTGLCIDTIKFSIIESGEHEGKFIATTNLSFKPFAYYAGDSERETIMNVRMGLTYIAPSLAFRVLRYSKNEYVVVLNEESFETAIIKNDTMHKLYTLGEPYWDMKHNSSRDGQSPDEIWFLYETWDTYLKRMMFVLIGTDNKLYDNINGKEINVAYSEILHWTVIKTKRNWAKVMEREYLGDKEQVAWIWWTDGEKFLIRLYPELYF